MLCKNLVILYNLIVFFPFINKIKSFKLKFIETKTTVIAVEVIILFHSVIEFRVRESNNWIVKKTSVMIDL